MKHLVLILSLGILLSCHSAGNIPKNKIPAEVRNDFNSRYPYARSLHWDFADGIYIARFNNVGDEQKEAYYDPNGTLIEVRD